MRSTVEETVLGSGRVGGRRDLPKQPGVSALYGRHLRHGRSCSTPTPPTSAAMYLMLDDFGKRTGYGLSADEIAIALQGRLQDELEETSPGITVNIFQAPPVEGLGTAGGFKIVVEDRGNEGLIPLETATNDVIERGASAVRSDNRPALEGLFTSFRAQTPWLKAEHRPRPGRSGSACPSAIFSTPYRTKSARSTSTTSTNSAGPGRSTSRPQEDFRQQVEDLYRSIRRCAAQPERRWCRCGDDGRGADDRPGVGDALQHVSGRGRGQHVSAAPG